MHACMHVLKQAPPFVGQTHRFKPKRLRMTLRLLGANTLQLASMKIPCEIAPTLPSFLLGKQRTKPQIPWKRRETNTHTQQKKNFRHFSETGRIRFWRLRFQTPSSMSFFALAKFQGGTHRVFLAELTESAPNSVRLSESSLLRNSTLETAFCPFPTFKSSQGHPKKVGEIQTGA